MMVVPFKAEHMRQIIEQDATTSLSAHIRPDHMVALEQSPWAFTGLVDGRVIGCAGVVSMWEGRGEAWAALGKDCGPHMLAITKTALGFFERCPLRRIEIVVAASFTAGHRWAKMLGFTLQTPLPMERYLPTGEAAFMYARVR